MSKLDKTLKSIDATVEGGPFSASWDSLRDYETPKWYLDAKFGSSIHWGVYCVPAFGNEWYPRQMYQRGTPHHQDHLDTYGLHAGFGYRDSTPMLTAENFDAAAWAQLSADAGARFAVPVAEHHDGFAMYDCSFSDRTTTKMRPKRDIIHHLVDIVSKNGALLLSIGPRADGTIPEPEVEMLPEIGRWLKVNGEAIYDTLPWHVFGEGPTKVPTGALTDTERQAFTQEDIRFTTKGDPALGGRLYATVPAWPDGELTITSLTGQTVADVALLGYDGTLTWSSDAEGLDIRMPAQKPCDHAFAFKITLG